MKVITIANRKGGIGKTTTAAALASCLQQKNYSVLLVDMDSQCNLSSNLGASISQKTILDVMLNNVKAEEAVQASAVCDIIPGSLEFGKINDALGNKTGREYRLLESLVQIKDDYDFCVIDTPPEIALATTNALTASDEVIIPTTAETFSLDGVSQLYSSIRDIWRYTNKSLKIAGILVTQFNSRTLLSKAMLEELSKMAEQMDTVVFENTIRRSIAVAEAQSLIKDLFTYNKRSTAAADYMKWVDEYLKEENL